jgi:hypothetical protein
MAVRGSTPLAASHAGSTPSWAMRATTRGPAMSSEEIDVHSPTATRAATARRKGSPPMATAATAPMSARPAAPGAAASRTALSTV